MEGTSRLFRAGAVVLAVAIGLTVLLVLMGGRGDDAVLDVPQAGGASGGPAEGARDDSVPAGADSEPPPGGAPAAPERTPAGAGGAAPVPGTDEVAPPAAGEIIGKVVDGRTKEALAGATVGWTCADASRSGTEQSGPGGRFRASGVPQGQAVRVKAEKAGYRPAERSGLVLAAGGGADTGILSLEPVPILQGRVMDKQGAPQGGARVELLPEYGFKLGPDMNVVDIFLKIARPNEASAATTTDKEGLFAFYPGECEEGTYCLVARAAALAAHFTHWLELKPGAERPMLEIVLEGATAVSGKVVDTLGAPVVGALVVAITEPGQESAFVGRFAFDKHTDTSGAGGTFRIEHLREVKYTFVARKDGFPDAMKEDVLLPLVKELLIEFPVGFTAEGTVLDAASGQPVAGAKITIIANGPGGFGEGQADADGRYKIENLAPGSFQIIVNAPGYPTVMEMLQGTAAGVTRKDIRLKRGIEISGKVTDARTGQPVAGVTLTAFSNQMFFGGKKVEAVSREDGTFTLTGASGDSFGFTDEDGTEEASQVMLIATKHGWTQLEPATAEVAAGQDRVYNVEVRLFPGVRVSGRVSDPRGKPVAGAEILVVSDHGWLGWLDAFLGQEKPKTLTSGDGTFEVSVPSGGQVIAFAEGYAFGLHKVPEAEGSPEQRGVEIRLTAGGTVTGQVLDEKGAPMIGEKISCLYIGDVEKSSIPEWIADQRRQPPLYRECRTDAGGAFRLERLKAGTWRIRAREGAGQPGYGERCKVLEGGTTPVRLQLAPLLVIEGVVTDAAGQPVEGVFVTARPVEEENEGFDNRAAQTSADGRFRIENVPEGRYVLTTWKEGYKPAQREDVAAGTVSVRIALEAGPDEEESDEWEEE